MQSYEIYRSTKKTSSYKKIAQTTAHSYTATLPTLNTTYYYKLRGVQKTDKGTFYTNWSPVLSTKGTLGKSSLKPGAVTYNSVKLSWTKADGATKYKLYRSTKKTKGYKHIKTTSSLSYTNKSLKTGTRYYYKVVPYRSATKGSTTKVLSAKPSLKKSMITRVSLGLGSAKISWTKVSGASGYKVYRATSKSGKYKLIKTTKSRSYTNKKLSNNKTYYYKVKAYRKIGSKKVYSGNSKEFKTVTPRKEGTYRFAKNTWVVLEVDKYYGVYTLCNELGCSYSNVHQETFWKRAYVGVPAGWSLEFTTLSGKGRVTELQYHNSARATNFSQEGWYLVGKDIKAGIYKVDGISYSLYRCEFYICDLSNGYDTLEIGDSTTYITLQDGDFLEVNIWSGKLIGRRI